MPGLTGKASFRMDLREGNGCRKRVGATVVGANNDESEKGGGGKGMESTSIPRVISSNSPAVVARVQ